jgi:hypothetical protein
MEATTPDLSYCFGSRAGQIGSAGVTAETVTRWWYWVIERDAGGRFALTDRGRATLRPLLPNL